MSRGPLTGYRVAVTAAHRVAELCALLSRAGAAVSTAPAIEMVALPDDTELRRATAALIASPPEVFVATTALGLRAWIAAADGWGVATDLLASVAGARILSRGPKATGALRAAGLREHWAPSSESSTDLLAHLLADGVAGRRVAVQTHGLADHLDPAPHLLSVLADAGAQLIPIRTYRWALPPAGGPLDRVIGEVVRRRVDAVAFTSAAAALALLSRADELGLTETVHEALRGDVAVFCVGPHCATPLARRQIPVSCPDRSRLGALARHIGEELPRLARRVVHAGGHVIEIRNAGVAVDGTPRAVPPSAMAALRLLARQPGAVVTRAELLRVLPGTSSDTHAVETAVLRLRTALGDRGIVGTVVKRGYRLAVDDRCGAA